MTQIVRLSHVQGTQLATVGVVDVDEVVASALDHAAVIWPSNAASSLTTSGTRGLTIRGSRDQLITALLNLLHNAIHYSDTKAQVVVTTRLIPDPDGERRHRGVRQRHRDQRGGSAPRLRAVGRFRPQPADRRHGAGPVDRERDRGGPRRITLWSRVGSGSTFTMELPTAPDLEDAWALY